MGPGKSIALTLRISFLCYSDAINLAKSNTAPNVMNIFITFFFQENGTCVGNKWKLSAAIDKAWQIIMCLRTYQRVQSRMQQFYKFCTRSCFTLPFFLKNTQFFFSFFFLSLFRFYFLDIKLCWFLIFLPVRNNIKYVLIHFFVLQIFMEHWLCATLLTPEGKGGNRTVTGSPGI